MLAQQLRICTNDHVSIQEAADTPSISTGANGASSLSSASGWIMSYPLSRRLHEKRRQTVARAGTRRSMGGLVKLPASASSSWVAHTWRPNLCNEAHGLKPSEDRSNQDERSACFFQSWREARKVMESRSYRMLRSRLRSASAPQNRTKGFFRSGCMDGQGQGRHRCAFLPCVARSCQASDCW